jgi:hypothetical protein
MSVEINEGDLGKMVVLGSYECNLYCTTEYEVLLQTVATWESRMLLRLIHSASAINTISFKQSNQPGSTWK